MEKKVLLKELVDTGTSLRKQITSKVRVSDQGAYPIGEIWDANTTINTIVDGATIAFDTLKEVEQKLNELDSELAAEISRAKAAEQAEKNRAMAAEQAETNRATSAEQAETNRATTAEQAEVDRATAAELTLSENIVAEQNRATAAENAINQAKADKTSVYTKTEVNNIISSLQSQIDSLQQLIDDLTPEELSDPDNE